MVSWSAWPEDAWVMRNAAYVQGFKYFRKKVNTGKNDNFLMNLLPV